MSNNLIVTRLIGLTSHLRPETALDLHSLYMHSDWLPKEGRRSTEAMRSLNLLGPLSWEEFSERDQERNYGHPSTSYAALSAACLLKLDQGIGSFSQLVGWLSENPSMACLLGFRERPASYNPAWRFAAGILPDQRHFSRLLHKAPNTCFQFLLSSSVQVLLAEFAWRNIAVPDTISLDTKHILAWVKENNSKAYIKNRFDKTQ